MFWFFHFFLQIAIAPVKVQRQTSTSLAALSSSPETTWRNAWLPLQEKVRLLCALHNRGLNLRALEKAGDFPSSLNAAESLLTFRRESWLSVLANFSMFEPALFTQPRSLSAQVPELLNEYIRLNRDACGFRFLPIFFQRHYHCLFRHEHSFPVILDHPGAPADAVAFFPAAGNILQVTAVTGTFGIMQSVTTTRIYDLERQCSAILSRPGMLFLPENKIVALLIGQEVFVWWPLSGNFSVPLGDIQEVQLSSSARPGIFYISVWDATSLLSVFICDVDKPGNFSKILYPVIRLDGDVADIHLPNEDQPTQLLLFPGAKRSGPYPNLLELHGRYLVDKSRLIGIEYFRENCAIFDYHLELAEVTRLPDETRRILISICELLQGPLPHEERFHEEISRFSDGDETEDEFVEETADERAEETLRYVKELIESVMLDEPENSWTVENIFKEAIGWPITTILLN